MPCYHPLNGWKSRLANESGKRSITFDRARGFIDMPVQVPCGQCIGCRLERSRQWAMRCVHEASLHEDNCFITLTYDDDHLPESGSLIKRDYQLFMKRLRKRFGSDIRFFHCGEYGETTNRPHYHACLFNFDFPDKVLLKTSMGNRLFISETLSELWPYGFSLIGDVTFESAAYVARYIMKKVTGDKSEAHYTRVDPSSGEMLQVEPEYVTMSRRPGIGSLWFDKFTGDVFPSDFITLRGKKMKPPKYYDRLYEFSAPDLLREIKSRRKFKAKSHSENNTLSRLQVRETVQKRRLEKLPRPLE